MLKLTELVGGRFFSSSLISDSLPKLFDNESLRDIYDDYLIRRLEPYPIALGIYGRLLTVFVITPILIYFN